MVTDYDCWHPDHDAVTVDAVVKVMHANGANARKLIMNVARKLGPTHTPSPHIETVLDTAIMTAPDKRDPRLIRKLDAIAGRVFPKTAPAKSKTNTKAKKRK
jgi:5'-methylthioadenosine phosphorylase